MTNYNDGKWHVWNGGECPVHPEVITDVQIRGQTREEAEAECGVDAYPADLWSWYHLGQDSDIVAFRVIENADKEPREVWLVQDENKDWFEAEINTPNSILFREVMP